MEEKGRERTESFNKSGGNSCQKEKNWCHLACPIGRESETRAGNLASKAPVGGKYLTPGCPVKPSGLKLLSATSGFSQQPFSRGLLLYFRNKAMKKLT